MTFARFFTAPACHSTVPLQPHTAVRCLPPPHHRRCLPAYHTLPTFYLPPRAASHLYLYLPAYACRCLPIPTRRAAILMPPHRYRNSRYGLRAFPRANCRFCHLWLPATLPFNAAFMYAVNCYFPHAAPPYPLPRAAHVCLVAPQRARAYDSAAAYYRWPVPFAPDDASARNVCFFGP